MNSTSSTRPMPRMAVVSCRQKIGPMPPQYGSDGRPKNAARRAGRLLDRDLSAAHALEAGVERELERWPRRLEVVGVQREDGEDEDQHHGDGHEERRGQVGGVPGRHHVEERLERPGDDVPRPGPEDGIAEVREGRRRERPAGLEGDEPGRADDEESDDPAPRL